MSQFSRNEWVYWDMYTMPIVGTVAYNDKTFVASFNMENNNQIIGELDTKRGLNGNIRVSYMFRIIMKTDIHNADHEKKTK